MKDLRLLGVEKVSVKGVLIVTYIYLNLRTGNVIRSDKKLHED